MNRKLLTGTSLVIAALLFVGVNLGSDHYLQFVRWDLTQNKLYTLSHGTRTILHNIKKPITLKLYFSRGLASNLPGINSYAGQVKQLLQQYNRVAGGKLHLKTIDPQPFSKQEDNAVHAGLKGIPVDQNGTTFYFGLVGTNARGDQRVIPFFSPSKQRGLEYDVTKLVYRLSHPQEPVVGLISQLPIAGGMRSRPWAIYREISQTFDVHDLGTHVKRIPSNVNVLMIVHPQSLGARTRYAIDQFALRGGHILLFVDPRSSYEAEHTRGMPMMGGQANSDLPQLFKAWGIHLTATHVVGDKATAQRVEINTGARPIIIDYPVWMSLGSHYLNKNDVITSTLGRINIGTPGALSPVKGASSHFEPLIHTGKHATLYSVKQLDRMSDPRKLLKAYKPMGQYTLAARITGKIHTAFPDGPPKPKKGKKAAGNTHGGKKGADSSGGKAGSGKKAPPKPLKVSQKPANIIVVADTDLLDNQAWVQQQSSLGQTQMQPFAANGDFVINALDNLSGSNALISIRDRGRFQRPFTRLDNMRRAAQQQYQDKEQALQQQLQQTQQKFQQLQAKRKGGKATLSPQEKKELQKFRQEMYNTREQLRQVQHKLRQDIDRLEGWLKFFNIGLIPLLIILGGGIVGTYRLRRRGRR